MYEDLIKDIMIIWKLKNDFLLFDKLIKKR